MEDKGKMQINEIREDAAEFAEILVKVPKTRKKDAEIFLKGFAACASIKEDKLPRAPQMDRKSVMLSRVRIDLTKFIATSFRNTKYKNKYKRRRREIRQEGQNQHHCVATYIDRMVSGETCILFIRKKEEPEESYYTVEVREGEVIQVRGKYNKDPGEDVKKFMNTFKKRIQMRKAG